jgi:hypothetical protein
MTTTDLLQFNDLIHGDPDFFTPHEKEFLVRDAEKNPSKYRYYSAMLKANVISTSEVQSEEEPVPDLIPA